MASAVLEAVRHDAGDIPKAGCWTDIRKENKIWTVEDQQQDTFTDIEEIIQTYIRSRGVTQTQNSKALKDRTREPNQKIKEPTEGYHTPGQNEMETSEAKKGQRERTTYTMKEEETTYCHCPAARHRGYNRCLRVVQYNYETEETPLCNQCQVNEDEQCRCCCDYCDGNHWAMQIISQLQKLKISEVRPTDQSDKAGADVTRELAGASEQKNKRQNPGTSTEVIKRNKITEEAVKMIGGQGITNHICERSPPRGGESRVPHTKTYTTKRRRRRKARAHKAFRTGDVCHSPFSKGIHS